MRGNERSYPTHGVGHSCNVARKGARFYILIRPVKPQHFSHRSPLLSHIALSLTSKLRLRLPHHQIAYRLPW
jgi:hypothetical protein